MARISGIDLPDNKRVDIGLTLLYGVGRANVVGILEKAGVDASIRIKDLSEEQVSKIVKAIEGMVLEGDLRRELAQNIKRLEDIGTYRGLRHRKGLPARGQNTRRNARTKKGKKKTVGTVKKETK
jgi:small subunit ribosomal protein S13